MTPIETIRDALQRAIEIADRVCNNECQCEPMTLGLPENSHPGYTCERCETTDQFTNTLAALAQLEAALQPATPQEIDGMCVHAVRGEHAFGMFELGVEAAEHRMRERAGL